jgi:peptide/nickel transport system permease protein
MTTPTADTVQLPVTAAAEIPIEYATQWQLIRRQFAKHRLAVIAGYTLIVLYLLAAFVEIFAPYPTQWKELGHLYAPPQLPRWSLSHGLHVYAVKRHVDPITYRNSYIEATDEIIRLSFFAKGEAYDLWELIPWDRHFIGVDLEEYEELWLESGRGGGGEEMPIPTFYLLGADKYGGDLFSRILYGTRVSLSVGIVGILLMFILGITIGGISGYAGGKTDLYIQRVIEITDAFPKLPLWIACAAIMPPDWSPVRVYFGITIVLGVLGWTTLARVVRGKILSLREEDYAVAAQLLGANHSRILFRHLVPGFTSHIIVSLTLSVPVMILGETSLSFLGMGLRPPAVSWGVLLQDCMNLQAVGQYPWLLLPVVFVVITVLGFNFLGDGMRDAADPYSSK